jgi:nucleoside-diphosphate-sugar epimerase
MKSAIITGVGGFIGSHLCNRLLNDGVKVYGIDVIDTVHERFRHQNYVPFTATFKDYTHLHDQINEPVDVFFHLAWAGGLLQSSFIDYELQLSNAKYACDAYMEAVKIGCKRFVNSGTNNQVEIKQFINTLDFQPRTTCIYATAKTALELIIRTLATKHETEYVATMIPMPYGEGNRSMQLFNVVMKSLIEGKSPSLIEGKNLYDMVYIEDIVGAFIAVAEKGKAGRSYYVGHRKLRTFRSWIEEIRDIVAPDVELKFGEYKDPLDLDYSLVDLDLLYKDTGYECNTTLKEILPGLTEWIKNNL